jgi:hypothetical protein
VTVHDLAPPVGPAYDGGLSFARTVQPVLDRHCINCHGLDTTEGGVNLLGNVQNRSPNVEKVLASTAYNSLVSRPGLVAMALRNKESAQSQPKDYFAHAGRLASLLLDGDEHHEKLEGESLQRVVDWLDLNAQFFGEYSWHKDEWRRPDPAGEAALREYIGKTFGSEWARQPYAALVNVSLIGESRILNAPLAISEGGWGQIPHEGWSSTADPGYQRMRQLVERSIGPRAAHDINATCGRDECLCRSCWVRLFKAAGGHPSASVVTAR